MLSVFARCPVARAKSRTWRGFATTTGSCTAANAAPDLGKARGGSTLAVFDEQRSGPGCSSGRVYADFCHETLA